MKCTHSAIKKMLGQMFQDLEIPAFRYELARRNDLSKKIHAFTKLSRADVYVVREKFMHRGGQWICVEHLNNQFLHSGGVIFSAIEWNLRASDHSLKRTFLDLINSERARLKIGKPPKNTGNRNVPVSWWWLELMDDPHNLDECDRSHLSKARKESAKLFPELLEVRREIEFNHSQTAKDAASDPEFKKRYYFTPYRAKDWE